MNEPKMSASGPERIAQNPNQGSYHRVLCVCSGGILRSPTAAWVFSQPPYSFNTRSAGTRNDALIQVSERLVNFWAEEIVCMEWDHHQFIQEHFAPKAPIRVLNIPDDYDFRDPDLVRRIRIAYERVTRKEI